MVYEGVVQPVRSSTFLTLNFGELSTNSRNSAIGAYQAIDRYRRAIQCKKRFKLDYMGIICELDADHSDQEFSVSKISVVNFSIAGSLLQDAFLDFGDHFPGL